MLFVYLRIDDVGKSKENVIFLSCDKYLLILVWLISISYIFNIKQTYKSDTDVISKIILALYASEIKKVRNYVNRNFISLKT